MKLKTLSLLAVCSVLSFLSCNNSQEENTSSSIEINTEVSSEGEDFLYHSGTMKNVLLASTSSLYGEGYLAYIKDDLQNDLFKDVDTITFIPYARPSGVSYEEYTQTAKDFFKGIGKEVVGIQDFTDPVEGIKKSKAFFVGGGNTFLLVKTLHDNGVMKALKAEVESGKPYLGTSAGSNIGGLNMKTTNDMPIVYPPSFTTMGLLPFNINPHYQDPIPNLKFNGETRETRIKEFLTQNDTNVVGLREGSWLRIKGDSIQLKGKLQARVFSSNKEPYEIAPDTMISFE